MTALDYNMTPRYGMGGSQIPMQVGSGADRVFSAAMNQSPTYAPQRRAPSTMPGAGLNYSPNPQGNINQYPGMPHPNMSPGQVIMQRGPGAMAQSNFNQPVPMRPTTQDTGVRPGQMPEMNAVQQARMAAANQRQAGAGMGASNAALSGYLMGR